MPERIARLTAPAWALLGLALLAGGVAAEADAGWETPGATGDLAAGLVLFAAGLSMCARAPEWWCGPLAILTGAAWFAGDLSTDAIYLYRGPLAHLLLTYPTGRTSSRGAIAVIAAAYVDGAVPELARADWPSIALAAALIGVAAWRYLSATGVERRRVAAPLFGAVATGGALAVAAALRLGGADATTGSLWALDVAVIAAAAALALDLRFGHWARGAVTGLVVDLGQDHEPQAIRSALARMLGDPSLEIAYRWPDRDAWVDEAGRVVELPGPSAGRTRTIVEDDGAPVAALIHDPRALGEEELARAVAAGVRLAVANARLQAEMAARVRDIEGSRRRLVETADAERRRFGELLRGGPEHRLEEAGARLERLAAGHGAVRELLDALAACRLDLIRFAQGLHPRALSEGGLRAALEEIAQRAGGPVTLDAPPTRFPPAQEEALFYFCSEALANVEKYAAGAPARVVIRDDGVKLVATVADEGPGGADPDNGSGLRGLSDRLEALGGALHVRSAQGAGTVLEAELPIGGPA